MDHVPLYADNVQLKSNAMSKKMEQIAVQEVFGHRGDMEFLLSNLNATFILLKLTLLKLKC